MWVTAGIVVAGAMSAGAQAYSANKAGKAAKSQAQNELQLKQEQFDYQRQLQQPFYDEGLPAFRSLSSAVNGTVDPATGRTWTPTNSPAYEWQRQQTEKNMGRKLRALGRENSTFGLNAMTESNRNLAASEWDKQIGRLADMSNIARGGASALAGISGNRVNSIGDYTNGMLAGNLISAQGTNNAIQTGMAGLNTAARLYQQPTLSSTNAAPAQGNSYGVLASDAGYTWGV